MKRFLALGVCGLLAVASGCSGGATAADMAAAGDGAAARDLSLHPTSDMSGTSGGDLAVHPGGDMAVPGEDMVVLPGGDMVVVPVADMVVPGGDMVVVPVADMVVPVGDLAVPVGDMAVPPAGTVTAMITAAAGGSITSDDGRLTLSFPPGAVGSDTPVSITPGDPAKAGAPVVPLGVHYLVGPEGLQFPAGALPTVTMTVTSADVAATAALPIGDAGAPFDGIPLLILSSTSAADVTDWPGNQAMDVSADGSTITLTAEVHHFSDWTLQFGSGTIQQYFNPIAGAVGASFNAFVLIGNLGNDNGFIYKVRDPISGNVTKYDSWATFNLLSADYTLPPELALSPATFTASAASDTHAVQDQSATCNQAGSGTFDVVFTFNYDAGSTTAYLPIVGTQTVRLHPKWECKAPKPLLTVGESLGGWQPFLVDKTNGLTQGTSSLINPNVDADERACVGLFCWVGAGALIPNQIGDASGAPTITQIPGNTLLPGASGAQVAMASSGGNFLYAVTPVQGSSSTVMTLFQFGVFGSMLMPLAVPSLPLLPGSRAMAVSSSGKFLYVVGQSAGSDVVQQFAINDDGTAAALTPATVPVLDPSGGPATGNTGEGIAVSPDGTGVFVPDHNAVGTHFVALFQSDPATGLLTPQTTPTVPTQSSTGIAVMDTGTAAYVYVGANPISQFQVTAGGLTALAPATVDVTPCSLAHDLSADPIDQMIFVPCGSEAVGAVNNIHAYGVGADGVLTEASFSPQSFPGLVPSSSQFFAGAF